MPLYTLEYLQKNTILSYHFSLLLKIIFDKPEEKIGKGIYVLMHVLFYLVIDIIAFLFPASITDGDYPL